MHCILYSLCIDSLVAPKSSHAIHKYYLTGDSIYLTGAHKYALKCFVSSVFQGLRRVMGNNKDYP